MGSWAERTAPQVQRAERRRCECGPTLTRTWHVYGEGPLCRAVPVALPEDDPLPDPRSPQLLAAAQLVFASMIEEIRANLRRVGFLDENNQSTNTFGDDMALMHSEISEALEVYRKRRFETVVERVELADGSVVDKPKDVASELADLFIRLLDNCARYGVDLAAEYRRKMDYNWTREWRHGDAGTGGL